MSSLAAVSCFPRLQIPQGTILLHITSYFKEWSWMVARKQLPLLLIPSSPHLYLLEQFTRAVITNMQRRPMPSLPKIPKKKKKTLARPQSRGIHLLDTCCLNRCQIIIVLAGIVDKGHPPTQVAGHIPPTEHHHIKSSIPQTLPAMLVSVWRFTRETIRKIRYPCPFQAQPLRLHHLSQPWHDFSPNLLHFHVNNLPPSPFFLPSDNTHRQLEQLLLQKNSHRGDTSILSRFSF